VTTEKHSVVHSALIVHSCDFYDRFNILQYLLDIEQLQGILYFSQVFLMCSFIFSLWIYYW